MNDKTRTCILNCHRICPPELPCWLRGCDDIHFLLDQKSAIDRKDFINYLSDINRPDLADDYCDKMRKIDLGITGAESLWHSISAVQRRVVELLSVHGHLERVKGKFLYCHKKPDGSWSAEKFRLSTVRNLAARDLLAWDGGAFDPEQKAIPTERLFFLHKNKP